MNDRYPFVNYPLQYSYSALEPYIDEKTMCLHHSRHLQTYIDNLNKLLKSNPKLQKYTLTELIAISHSLIPALGIPLKNNAGGVYNHRMFFEGMQPAGSGSPVLQKALSDQFKSYDNFMEMLKQAALSVFGSGYAWLISENQNLKIITTANQDTPDLTRCTPIICLDVWEHAYYLKHYNVRSSYIDDWFNVISLSAAEQRYLNAV